MTIESDMDRRALRDCFGEFATGVTVVACTGPDGRPHGATVNSFTTISLDPPLVLVSLRRESRSGTHLENAPFSVNVLRREQQAAGLHFAGVPDSGAEIEWAAPDGGPPVLSGTLATLRCAPHRVIDGGDHVIFLGRVTDIAVHGGEPLVFHRGRFQRLEAEQPAPALIEWGAPGWYGDSPLYTPA